MNRAQAQRCAAGHEGRCPALRYGFAHFGNPGRLRPERADQVSHLHRPPPQVRPGHSYEAKGDGSPDMVYFEISPNGKLLHEIWFKTPYAAMAHDCEVPPNYIVLPIIPLTVDVGRMKRGGQNFEWQPDLSQLFVVQPRRGSVCEVRWLTGPVSGFQGHTLNSFEENGLIHVDMPVTGGNIFYFFPQEDGLVPPPETQRSSLHRWLFDLNVTSDSAKLIQLNDYQCEFPSVDYRYIGQHYEHGFMLAFDPARPYRTENAPIPFQFFNLLTHFNLKTGVSDSWFAGYIQEPTFVTRSADAGDRGGYVIALFNHIADYNSVLVALDSRDMASDPVARSNIPLRTLMSLHGSWSPAVQRMSRYSQQCRSS